MSLISLSGIKFRAKSVSSQTIVGGFPDYTVVPVAEAIASAISPYITKKFVSVPAISTALNVAPVPNVKPNSVAANAVASIVEAFVTRGEPHPNIVEAIASVVSPLILEEIPITPSISSASIVVPEIKLSIISSVAAATASISTVVTTGGSTTQTVLQLSFPEETEYPLWAGNLSGQSFDDTMLVVINEITLTDAILLEDGSGGISLEDGTGVILLESATAPEAAIGEEGIGEG